jgi:hypothetical protein
MTMRRIIDMHSLAIYNQVADTIGAVMPQYPELGSVPPALLLGSRRMHFTMAVRPISVPGSRGQGPGFLLELGHGKRHYHWEFLGPSARHGLIAHELAHLVQFGRMDTIGLGIAMLRYLFSHSYRRAFEREADAIAIGRGYGRQLEQYARFAAVHGPVRHRRRKARFYMSPREINIDTRLWELKRQQ